jgi:FkbM family methyltransferase
MHPHISHLQLLKDRGYTPSNLLDIGACFGEWTEAFHVVFPNTDALLIEGNEERRPALEKFGQPFEMALLGDSDKPSCKFYVGDAASTGGNSIYREKTNFYFRETEVPMHTLDGLLAATGRSDVHYDFMKLDVQGAELDILKGATQTLKHTQFILMELRVLDYNDGAPTFAEAISFMDQAGFRLCNLFEMNSWLGTSLLSEMDVLFARKDSWVFEPPVNTSAPSMPPEMQVKVLHRLIPLLAPQSPTQVVVAHNENDGLIANYIADHFRQTGMQCKTLNGSDLDSCATQGSVVYILPGSLTPQLREKITSMGCVTITGYPELVKKGDVSIGLTTTDDSRIKLIGSLESLNREGVSLPDHFENRVEMIAA